MMFSVSTLQFARYLISVDTNLVTTEYPTQKTPHNEVSFRYRRYRSLPKHGYTTNGISAPFMDYGYQVTNFFILIIAEQYISYIYVFYYKACIFSGNFGNLVTLIYILPIFHNAPAAMDARLFRSIFSKNFLTKSSLFVIMQSRVTV